MARPILKEGPARVSAVHAALQQKKPVVFSASMRNLWITYSKINPICNGILEPLPEDQTPDFDHAMVILGYDTEHSVFIVENSFGSVWGYNGFGYISPDFVARNPTHGYWVIEGGPRWID